MIKCNKKSLSNGILLLALIVCVLLCGCGRKPPEAYWTWTKEDSTAIQTIVDQWRNYFTTTFEDTVYRINFRADTIRVALYEDIRNLWMRPHYWPGSFTRTVDNYKMIDSFIPTKDTTVLVKLTERISGTIKIRMDSCTIKVGDTVVGANTYPLYTRYFVYAPDTMIEKSYQGTSYRYLHFDKKSGSWQFTKMSGGARFFIPSEADAPYLVSCTLKTTTKSYGVLLRPDTTQYGIQRFYYLDSIMNFSVNDTAFTTKIMTYDPPIIFGFWHHKKKRYDLNLRRPATPQPTPRVLPLTTGWDNVMFELVPYEALCKRGNYNALFWILPMKINLGGIYEY